MKPWLRRFAAVGLLVTALDIGLLLLLGPGPRPAGRRSPTSSRSTAAATVVVRAAPLASPSPTTRTSAGCICPSPSWPPRCVGRAVDVLVLQTLGQRHEHRRRRWARVVKLPAHRRWPRSCGCAAYRAVLFTGSPRDLAERRASAAAPGRRAPVGDRAGVQRGGSRSSATGRAASAPSSPTVAADGGLEIVVVDDGSGDGTADVARAGGRRPGRRAAREPGQGCRRPGRDAGRHGADAGVHRRRPRLRARRSCCASSTRWRTGGTSWSAAASTPRPPRWSGPAACARSAAGSSTCSPTPCCSASTATRSAGSRRSAPMSAAWCSRKARIDGFAFDVEVFHLVERYRLSLAEVPVSVENSRAVDRARRCGTRSASCATSSASAAGAAHGRSTSRRPGTSRCRPWPRRSGAERRPVGAADPRVDAATRVAAAMAALDDVFKAYDIRGTVPDQLDAAMCRGDRRRLRPLRRSTTAAGATGPGGPRHAADSGVELAAAFAEGVAAQGRRRRRPRPRLHRPRVLRRRARSTPRARCSPPRTTRRSTTASSSASPAPRPVGEDTGLGRIKALAAAGRAGVRPTAAR